MFILLTNTRITPFWGNVRHVNQAAFSLSLWTGIEATWRPVNIIIAHEQRTELVNRVQASEEDQPSIN